MASSSDISSVHKNPEREIRNFACDGICNYTPLIAVGILEYVWAQ
jgi:hypothetical protein